MSMLNNSWRQVCILQCNHNIDRGIIIDDLEETYNLDLTDEETERLRKMTQAQLLLVTVLFARSARKAKEALAEELVELAEPNFDPINDEKKPFDLQEWASLAKSEVDKYVKTFQGQNEFHKVKHTWTEWFTSFHQYMSW